MIIYIALQNENGGFSCDSHRK